MATTLDLMESATFLRISRETMLELADAGELFGAKIGRAWIFLESDLEEYLLAQSRQQTAARRERRLASSQQEKVQTAVSASAKTRPRRQPLPDFSPNTALTD